ncbi:DUF1330 domain-containing protein [Gilvimarinus sp. SDUM040013]|uniref:DUF1330 domain-containing protein n=1 Tax=Gilvimarinus gilvus TaxID=3058038 RepID=A0ABU4S1C3_9GAMM|nr:DUF1330 domain-containing protein [Gilvimarinus sp. SDUM040013]MDO3385373.1 DUF1330 domain-containing protein [Gilvimarinus sp. SDUM040013]MDX6850948.1 DUF1330 domain-containing protein [Gilvimarinus sp. SDUM040013]
MRSYILVDVNIKEMEGFMDYATRIPELIERHGGRYIVKGAEPEVIRDGDSIPQYAVVIEFPTTEAADGFIQERSKSELIDVFNRSTTGRILKVDGCL